VLRHHEPVMPEDDPLAYDPVAAAADQAAYEAYLENLAPPDWFYPLVGEVASQTVLLELCMTEAALALTGTKRDPYELIKYTNQMDAVIATAAATGDERFGRLLDPFHRARDDRNRIVHALLRWQESDGESSDHWLQTHPRSKTETFLPTRKPPQSMTDALHNIKYTTQAAFELTQEILAR
jgi:hypothetical protein